jgi:hypothetical protein
MERVKMRPIPLVSNPTVKISDIKTRRFNILEREPARLCPAQVEVDTRYHISRNRKMSLCGVAVTYKENKDLTEETMSHPYICSDCKNLVLSEEVVDS